MGVRIYKDSNRQNEVYQGGAGVFGDFIISLFAGSSSQTMSLYTSSSDIENLKGYAYCDGIDMYLTSGGASSVVAEFSVVANNKLEFKRLVNGSGGIESFTASSFIGDVNSDEAYKIEAVEANTITIVGMLNASTGSTLTLAKFISLPLNGEFSITRIATLKDMKSGGYFRYNLNFGYDQTNQPEPSSPDSGGGMLVT